MRILLLLAGVAGLALTTPVAADQGKGNGRGGGGGGGGEQRGRGHDGGGDRGNGNRAERGRGNDERAHFIHQRAEQRGRGREERAQGRQERRAERAQRREDRRFERAERRAERGFNRNERRSGREGRRVEREERRAERQLRREDRGQQRAERRAVRLAGGAQVAQLRWDDGFAGVRGCPPGLARRDNGCMPPGLARQQAAQQSWYDGWWTYDRGDPPSVYNDGYLLRLNQNGSVASYLPLLGGALWPGRTWPSQFEGYSVPDYHTDYFGLDEPYDYRLADGAIYGVDPTSQAIHQVVALVAGEQFNIGQPMPEGYDVYNVPYEYRDQYQDSEDSLYRYSDGYVYQVDPTTQLIQAAIQLIA